MITARKLASLPRKTRERKIITIIEEWERMTEAGSPPPAAYIVDVLSLLEQDKKGDERLFPLIEELKELYSGKSEPAPPPETMYQSGTKPAETQQAVGVQPADTYAPEEQEKEYYLRKFDNLKFLLMNKLGITQADWDHFDPETQKLIRSKEKVLPLRVYLDDVRSPFNVGSIFRTAEAFGAERVLVSRYTAGPDHKRALRTSMGTTEILPWEVRDIDQVERRSYGPLFALELGGTPIDEFDFPSEGIVVLGSEELGVSPEARAKAESEGGIVSIPLYGAKASLNIAVAFGILMHRWRSAISP